MLYGHQPLNAVMGNVYPGRRWERFMDPELAASIKAQLQLDEGKGPVGLGHVYPDTEKIPTIVYGYNLGEKAHLNRLEELGYDSKEVLAGRQTITEEHADRLFDESFAVAVKDAKAFLPGLESYPEAVQSVVVNMSFNLGGDRLSKFVDLRDALLDRDYETAAKEMVDSVWYGQVGDRSERLVNEMQGVTVQPLEPVATPSVTPDPAPVANSPHSELLPVEVPAPSNLAPEPAHGIADQVPLPSSLQETELGPGPSDYRAEFTQFLDHPPEGLNQTNLDSALQPIPSPAASDPAVEPHSGGSPSGAYDFFGSFLHPSMHAEPGGLQPASGASQTNVPATDQSTPSVFDHLVSAFFPPHVASESWASDHDSVSPFGPSQDIAGHTFGSLFGGGESLAPSLAPSYDSSPATDFGHSNHDSGYSHHDSATSNQDSSTSNYDSGVSSHDSSGYDAGV